MNLQITRPALLSAPGTELDNIAPMYELHLDLKRESFTQPFRLSHDPTGNTLKFFHGNELLYEYQSGDTVNNEVCNSASDVYGKLLESIHYT